MEILRGLTRRFQMLQKVKFFYAYNQDYIEGEICLKEFTVCYTFDNNIVIEKIFKESDFTIEDVKQEIIEKMDRCRYFIVKNEKGIHMIHSCLVRYVQVNEKILV
jgi:hypothetical protein